MGIFLGSTPVSVYFNGTAAQVAGVYLGSVQVFPTGAATVPGAPEIDFAAATNGTTVVVLFGAPDDGGSPITSYEFTFDGVPVVPDTADLESLSFTFNANYAGQDASVRAVNAVGPGEYSTPSTVA